MIEEKPFNYTNFDQNYYKWRMDWINYDLFFLLKESRFQEHKFARGNYHKQIDFKRDFHFNLKDESEYVNTFDSTWWCNTNFGVAVILGPFEFNDYPERTGENLLFNGLTNSVVIAFRANYKEIVIYDCKKKECNLNNKAKRRDYPFTNRLKLNMHIVYIASEHKLQVYDGHYSADTDIILEYIVNLAEGLENGNGYLGLTATDFRCGLYHHLTNSYICLNGGEPIHPTVTLKYNEEIFDIYNEKLNNTIPVIQRDKVEILIEYDSIENRKLMGEGQLYIENELFEGCKVTYNDKRYVYECFLPEEYGLYNITYLTFYESFSFFVDVQSSEIDKLVYAYGKVDTEDKSCSIITDNGVRYLKYGSLSKNGGCGGDFDLSEFSENEYLIFYAKGTDKNGKGVNIRDLEAIKEALKLSCDSDVILEKANAQFIYKVGVKVTKKGTYSIKAKILDRPIYFNVRNLVPNIDKSNCKIENSLENPFKSHESIKYICEFNDNDGLPIQIEEAIDLIQVSFKTKIIRLKNNIEFEPKEEYYLNNLYTFIYETNYNGKYKFEIKVGLKNMETVISSPTFDVSPEPITLENSLIYHFTRKEWIEINNIERTDLFYYDEEKENNENLFMIDLVDMRDPDKTKYSDIEQPYENFNPILIEGKIYEYHSEYEENLSFEIIQFENKNYILAKLKNKNEMRRSSYDYIVTLDFNITKNLTFNYILYYAGDYKVCRKELNLSNTIIKTTETNSIIAGRLEKVGQIVLRTDLDHLYNYFLESQNLIDHIDVCIEPNTCEVQLSKNEVEGVYDVRFSSNLKGKFNITFKINDSNLFEGKDFCQVKVEPIPEAFIIDKNKTDKNEFVCGKEVIFEFTIKDIYGNLIEYDLPPDNFGLSYSIKINGEEKSSSSIKLDKKPYSSSYYIKESNTISGNYSLTLKTKNSKLDIVYNYFKSPGEPSSLYSKLKLLNNNKLNLHDISMAELKLSDKFGNEINPNLFPYDKLKNIDIYALNGNNDRIDYYSEGYTYKSYPINITGSYYLYGKVNNEYLLCTSCNFDVVDYGFDFDKSQLRMIGENSILMKEENYYTLYKGLQKPAFEFDFMTQEGLPSNEIKREETNIEACITNEEERLILNETWLDKNKLLWALPDDYDLEENKNYTIEISNNNTIRSYYLSIVIYGKDESSDNAYSLSNTYISPSTLYLTAGNYETFMIEFRGKDNLRFNQDLNIDELNVNGENDLPGLEVLKRNGNKKGQFIVDIKLNKTCDFYENCKILIFYESHEIGDGIQIVVKSNILHHFSVDPSSISKGNSLKPGVAGNPTKINLIPLDQYGNLIKESIFDSKIYQEESLRFLFNLKHQYGYKASLTTTTNPVSFNVELSLSSEKTGELTLSSIYLENDYTMEINAGEVSKYSTGYLDDDSNAKAGTNKTFIIEPRDINGNRINNKDIINDYSVRLYDVNGNIITSEITVKYNESEGHIEYTIKNEKVETKIIKAYYKNEEIIVNNNIINVIYGDPDIDKTKLIYNGKAYSLDNPITISLASLPIIDLQLYDNFNNRVDINAFKEKEFKLKVGGNVLSKYIEYNDIIRLYIDDYEIDNYFSIKKTETNNILYIKLDSFVRNISFTFEDESPQKDEEVPKSFVLDKDNLILKAGEQGLISMKFYSEKSKIIGNFFNLTEIKVFCANDKIITTNNLYGKNYGYYHVFISSDKATNEQIKCSINVQNLNKEFKLRIIPNKPKYCQHSDSLTKSIAGKEFSLEFKCFDDYENVVYLDENQFDAKIINKYKEYVGYNINLNMDNSLNLYFLPNTEGNYTIKSLYFEDIHFETFPGEISPENSYLDIKKDIDAGEELIIDIYIRDKFNNVVDADKDHIGLFDLYYRYPENSKYNEYRKVTITPTIENVEDKKIIRYRYIVIDGGINEFRGIYKETSTILQCSNCEINVKPGEFDLNETDIYAFNTFSQSYKKLKKYNDNLYNVNENLLIRVYPKDKYGNKISAKNLSVSVSIDGKELKKENPTEEFLEFKENTGKFSNLINNEYDLIITDENNNITYKVDVSGEDGFNGNVYELNTKLLYNNLEFTAGQHGYFNLELRNANNIRYNKKFDGTIQIKPSNENITYSIYNKKSSTILVLVTTNISNVFPNNEKLYLEILINNKKAFVNNLELLVHPDDLFTAEINPYYLDNNKINQLKSVTADDSLRFSLIGKDYLNNKVLINPNEVKLLVKRDNKEISYKSSYIDVHTGEQKYLYDLTLKGLYKITSGENAKEKNFFNGITYTIEVTHGEVSPEKTIARLLSNSISAGENASLVIIVKDKNNNDVEFDNTILEDFWGDILSNDYILFQLNYSLISNSSFKYEELLEKVGTYRFNVGYKKRKIKCDKLIVNPSECIPDNTLIYSKDINGEYIAYNGETYIYSSFNSPLSIHLEFRDDFFNPVNDNKDIKVENAFLYGNNMNNLEWDYNNGELYLDLKNPEKKNNIEHLVSRYDNESYNFNFTVNYNNNKKEFTLNVNHFGKKEDEKEYGNGDYDVFLSDVKPKVATFRAGTSYEVFLTLRTNENLTYNGDFNMDNIKCDELDPPNSDPSFTCTKSKNDTGIYSLKYYTTLAKNKTVEIKNVIKLSSSDNKQYNIFNVFLNNTFGIPYKYYTKIVNPLPETINPDNEQAIIIFTLKDKYGNEFNSEDIISDLVFENHGIQIESTIQYKVDDKSFSATLYPTYPPKDLEIQLYYKEGENKIELFPEVQISELEFDIDYSKTVVKSTNINQMKAGEFLDLSIILYDKNNLCYNKHIASELLFVNVQGPLKTSTQIRKYTFSRHEEEQSPCKYIYRIDINETNRYTETGSYSIIVYVNGGNTIAASYSQNVISNEIDSSKFKIYYTDMEEKLYDDQNIPAGDTIHFTAQAYDQYNNKIDQESLSEKLFTIDISPNRTNNIIKYYNGGSGALNILFNTTKVGKYIFDYKYNNKHIDPDTSNGPSTINIVAGSCSVEYNYTDYPNEDDSDISIPYTYNITCHDKYNNIVKKGGAKFKSEITLFIKESQSTVDLEYKVKDNEDGTYSITFTPPLSGEYAVSTYLDGKKYSEKMFNITGKKCDFYKCPNTGKCVDDLTKCIPEEYKCRFSDQIHTTPFQCDNETDCVDSMTKCIPEGASQCKYMKTLYPEGKDYLCSFYLPIDCKRKYPSYRTLCDDGICRTSKKLQPNQRVCPIGTFLCPDLTCKDKFENCYTNWPQCGSTQIRCPDQSCTDDQKNCPTTITCSNPSHYVCPDGTCVENEIYCAKLKTCPDETPYLCSDNSCATQPENCPHTVACGHGKSLCSDFICRETC